MWSVTNSELPRQPVVRFCNKQGTTVQWIKEGKMAVDWTHLASQSVPAE
jgi:hypothetical protein